MAGEIEALDAALEVAGEDIILRRRVGQAPNVINLDVKCRALVRSYRLRDEELISAVKQDDLLVTISPTEIADAQWPGGHALSDSAANLPRRGDSVILHGRLRAVEVVTAIAAGGMVVRIEMRVLG